MKEICNIIIGGGISGLYIGYQLFKKGEKFLILEGSDYLGGRIYTQYFKGDVLELGASIFHSNQKNIMTLIKDFHLTNDLVHLKNDKEPIFTFNNTIIDSNYIQSRLEFLYSYLRKESNKFTLSLQKLAKEVLEEDDYNFLIEYTKDWYEVKDQNSEMYFENIDNVNKVYKLKNGLSQLIKRMGKVLEKNIILKQQISLVNFNEKREFEIDRKWKCKNLYLCTNLKGAKQINWTGLKIKSLLDIIKPVASLRFYVVFKRNDIIPNSIISNKGFKWCIPTGKKSAMITYTDGALATRFYNLGEKKSLELILKDLSQILGKNITKKDISKTFFSYWKEAIIIVKGDVAHSEYQDIIKSYPKNFKQTVVPLDFGLNQGWMEGSLMNI